MKIYPTPIIDLKVIKGVSVIDERGAFERFFCDRELSSIIGNRKIVQINHSYTKNIGAIRGLHYQRLPYAELKLVRCLRGKVWDVAVDLRPNSSSYKRWYSQELSPKNLFMMIIPEGFAHGFQVLEEDSELLYMHTAFYNPDSEDGIRYDDPELGINWPLPVTDISKRDVNYAYINSNFVGIDL